MLDQIELNWFPEDRPDLAPNRELRAIMADFEDPHGPLWNFIGNEAAKRQLARAAFVAFERYNHRCNDQIFAFVGPPSSGKTHLAHLYAELVGLPLVVVDVEGLSSVHDVMVAIAKVLEATEIDCDGETDTLELREVDDGHFVVPPIIVLVDDFERLDPTLRGTFAANLSKQQIVTEKGWTFEIGNIAWILATSDSRSFDAFIGRLSRIDLKLYSRLELAMIAMRHFPGHPAEFYTAATERWFCLPTEILTFAQTMLTEQQMRPSKSWPEVAAIVAADLGIDDLGFTKTRKAIVNLLADGKCLTLAELADAVCSSETELRRIHLVPLLAETPDRPNILTETSSGISLSRAMQALAEDSLDQDDSEDDEVDSEFLFSPFPCPFCEQPFEHQDGPVKCPACNREFAAEASGEVICIYLKCPSCGEGCSYQPNSGEKCDEIQCDACHLTFPVDERGEPIGRPGKCVWCDHPIWYTGIGSATCENCGLENPVDEEGKYSGKGNVRVTCPKCGHAFDAPKEVIEQGMDLLGGASVAPPGYLPCEKCDHPFSVDLEGRLTCPGEDHIPCDGTLAPDGTETFANGETFDSFVCTKCNKDFIFHDQHGLITSNSHAMSLMEDGCHSQGGEGESDDESEQE